MFEWMQASYNKKESASYITRWVKTKDHGDKKFPLVYLCDGTLSYSLLCYVNHLFVTKKGKNTSQLNDLFRVVGAITEYNYYRKDRVEAWAEKPQLMLLEFFQDFFYGTAQHEGGCPYGLSWTGVSLETLKKCYNQWNKYAKYVHQYLNYSKLVVKDFYATSSGDGWHHFDKNEYSLLKHLDVEEATNTNWSKKGLAYEADPTMKTWSSIDEDFKFFPPFNLTALILQAKDVNQQAIYLLCAFTGLRASEALHIMITDIVPSEESLLFDCEVMLSPPHGKTWCHDTNQLIEREEILAKEQRKDLTGIDVPAPDMDFLRAPMPRTLLHNGHKLRLGWKGVTLAYAKEAKYKYTLQWSNDYARIAFEKLIPELRNQARVGHPFLFCGENGMPLCYNTYYRRIRRDSERICGHKFGTHSLRHFFGFYLSNCLELSKEDAQINMRHATVLSTEKYYNLTVEKSRDTLKEKLAMARQVINLATKIKWKDLEFKSLTTIR